MRRGGDEDHRRHNVDQSLDRLHPSARIRKASEIADFGVGEFANPGLKFEVADNIGIATIEFPNYSTDEIGDRVPDLQGVVAIVIGWQKVPIIDGAKNGPGVRRRPELEGERQEPRPSIYIEQTHRRAEESPGHDWNLLKDREIEQVEPAGVAQ